MVRRTVQNVKKCLVFKDCRGPMWCKAGPMFWGGLITGDTCHIQQFSSWREAIDSIPWKKKTDYK